LDEEASRQAFLNEYDFDSPDAIDFDILVSRLRDLKAGYTTPNAQFGFRYSEVHRKRAEIPVYSFTKHARESHTTSIYSPHVLILEGIFALYDPRVLELLDMKVFLLLPWTFCEH
jgi:uridine kinase